MEPPTMTSGNARPGSRERLLQAASGLLRQRGYHAMGLKEVAKTGEAPIGSVYHYFPGGKEQLAEEALRSAGDATGRALATVAADADSVESLIAGTFELMTSGLIASGFKNGCPIATAVLEVSGESSAIQAVGREVFQSWHQIYQDRFCELGLSGDDSRILTTALLCGLEGALIMSRASGDRVELDTLQTAITRLGRQLACAQ